MESSTGADDWNDTFHPPRSYEILRSIVVRSGPGNHFPTAGSVREGQIVPVESITSGWCLLELPEGGKAYLFKRYLRPVGAPGGAASSEPVVDWNQPTPQELAAEDEAPGGMQPFVAVAPQAGPSTSDKSSPEAAKTIAEPAQAAPSSGQVKEGEQPARPSELTPPALQASPYPQPSAPVIEPRDDDAPRSSASSAPPSGTQISSLTPRAQGASGTSAASVPVVRLKGDGTSLDAAGCTEYLPLATFGRTPILASGDLAMGGQVCLRFLALGDREMDISLNSTKGAAAFDVYTPSAGRVAVSQTRVILPRGKGGDRIIVIRASTGSASWRLEVGEK